MFINRRGASVLMGTAFVGAMLRNGTEQVQAATYADGPRDVTGRKNAQSNPFCDITAGNFSVRATAELTSAPGFAKFISCGAFLSRPGRPASRPVFCLRGCAAPAHS
jgi:hypothetical protein